MVPVHLIMAAGEARSVSARFKDAGATEPGKAMPWKPRNRTQVAQFKSLIARGVLVEMRPGTWYLNEEKLAASGGPQAVLVAVLVGLAAVGAGTLLLLQAN